MLSPKTHEETLNCVLEWPDLESEERTNRPFRNADRASEAARSADAISDGYDYAIALMDSKTALGSCVEIIKIASELSVL